MSSNQKNSSNILALSLSAISLVISSSNASGVSSFHTSKGQAKYCRSSLLFFFCIAINNCFSILFTCRGLSWLSWPATLNVYEFGNGKSLKRLVSCFNLEFTMSLTFGRPYASFLILLEVGLLHEIVVPEAAQGHDISPFATESIPDRQRNAQSLDACRSWAIRWEYTRICRYGNSKVIADAEQPWAEINW